MADSVTEELVRLEQRVEALLKADARLREENRVLRQSLEQLNAERASLKEKNDLARSQIEAMISRLRAMEHG
ncbi:TIGR02449 family protein [Alkalilimnicola ehrlichii MLHE-1]|uniref:TIGR02449 family protein n=1 Tax=Alkalilimnicola ehrlichii (strain ATCC BAA-1101 / DSM 17681 / MLHE-1) TaxID=187272 RepID=Q0A5K7_ALKEH|nr:TIGR02449 family protein [Alkalilimnicola ehrlichii]ABI57880.1 conserved hypothetical protein [Alkalilimnicola ehrlichii MLHE-1]